MADLKITDGDDTVEFQLDAALAREADLQDELHLTAEERDHAKRNSSAFEERMGNLQVENGKLHDQLAALREDNNSLAERFEQVCQKRDALREELAVARHEVECRISAEVEAIEALQAAEQRNALPEDWADQLFAEMARRFDLRKQIDDDHMVNDDTQIGVEFAIKWIDAALKPTESGAS